MDGGGRGSGGVGGGGSIDAVSEQQEIKFVSRLTADSEINHQVIRAPFSFMNDIKSNQSPPPVKLSCHNLGGGVGGGVGVGV